MVASLDFTIQSKVKSVCTVSQQGRGLWKAGAFGQRIAVSLLQG